MRRGALWQERGHRAAEGALAVHIIADTGPRAATQTWSFKVSPRNRQSVNVTPSTATVASEGGVSTMRQRKLRVCEGKARPSPRAFVKASLQAHNARPGFSSLFTKAHFVRERLLQRLQVRERGAATSTPHKHQGSAAQDHITALVGHVHVEIGDDHQAVACLRNGLLPFVLVDVIEASWSRVET